MLRLGIFLVAILAGSVLLAQNAERALLFHFNATQISPDKAGEARLREVVLGGLVLWVAPPAPDKPVVLYFHGNAGNLANRTWRFSAFLDRGFGVVAMAYPGSSGSTGEQSSEAINRHAKEVFLALPDLVGPAPVILYGESMGAGVAVQLAHDLQAMDRVLLPAAMVLEAPFTSILDVGKLIYPLFASVLHFLGDPWRSADLIAAVPTPLLILHGSADRIIPVHMGRELFALSGASNKQIFIAPGASHHNVWQPEALKVMFSFIEQF